jgi:hypothetical protein
MAIRESMDSEVTDLRPHHFGPVKRRGFWIPSQNLLSGRVRSKAS